MGFTTGHASTKNLHWLVLWFWTLVFPKPYTYMGNSIV